MEQKQAISLKKKIVVILIMLAAITGLLLTAHVLVNYFDLVGIIKSVHGG